MTADPLRSGRAPLFLKVAELLRQDIEEGRPAPDELLPTFDALAERFGVSRITVREAMAVLAEEGLVEPRRGRGTRVLPSRGARQALKVETRLADLVAMYRGDLPELVPLADAPAELPPGPPIGHPAAEGYHLLKRMHDRDGQRYCIISLYFPTSLFRRHEARLRSELALPVLTSEPGIEIAEARQTLRIGKAGLEVAERLGLAIGDPVAHVRRVFCDPSGEVIYLADVTYRGDYVHLEMDLLS